MFPSEYLEFSDLFNRGEHFEAHEALELLWRKETGENKDFYQGLIQIAAVFVHIKKGTPEGGKKLLKSAEKYLEKYPANLMGLDREKLLAETRICLQKDHPFPKITLE